MRENAGMWEEKVFLYPLRKTSSEDIKEARRKVFRTVWTFWLEHFRKIGRRKKCDDRMSRS